MSGQNSNILTSLDIGSNKIVCMIGFTNSDGKLYIKGFHHRESEGIKNGEIDDIKLLTRSIIKTIDSAEKKAGVNAGDIVVNVSGVSKLTAISNRNFGNKIVKKSDIYKLSKNIEEKVKEEKKEIIHLIPIRYDVDDMEVANPFGMRAEKLRVKFNSVTVEKAKLDNLKSCLEGTILNIVKFIYTPYASALSCTTEQERNDGCIVVDIGAVNSSFVVMEKGIFKYGETIKGGGNDITNKVAEKFKLKFENAEKIKTKNVNLTLAKSEENELIDVALDTYEEYAAASSRKSVINDIYRNKIVEIIYFVLSKVKNNSLLSNMNKTTLILTGGTSCVLGLDTFVSEQFNIKTRIGIADFNLILNDNMECKDFKSPLYSTALGMLLYLADKKKNEQLNENQLLRKSAINRLFDFLIRIFIN